MNSLHAYVSGRVQGVYFRGWTRGQAQRLGLTGWVRNLRDGRVEIQAYGPDTVLRELLEQLHEGPPFSRVDDIEILDMVGDQHPPNDFTIAATA